MNNKSLVRTPPLMHQASVIQNNPAERGIRRTTCKQPFFHENQLIIALLLPTICSHAHHLRVDIEKRVSSLNIHLFLYIGIYFTPVCISSYIHA